MTLLFSHQSFSKCKDGEYRDELGLFAVDDLVRQAEIDKFQLNETKCKELQISLSSSVLLIRR